MNKTLTIISCFLGMLAVILGAFGSHGLKDILTPKMMEVYKTANFYHFIHAVLGTFLCFQFNYFKETILKIATVFFLVGIFIFSGSLYTLVITDILWLGAITPIGGTFFIIGWFLLIVFGVKYVK